MKKIIVQEDGAPVNAVGGGAIAGLGVGPQGEPPVRKRKKFSVFMRSVKK